MFYKLNLQNKTVQRRQRVTVSRATLAIKSTNKLENYSITPKKGGDPRPYIVNRGYSKIGN